MSLLHHHSIIGQQEVIVPFDNTIVWNKSLDGVPPYQELPTRAALTEIDYGTSLGTDTFMHIPFVKRIGNDLVVTYQVGLEDEDTAGQTIQMKYKTGNGGWSARTEVFPAFSDSGSAQEVIPISLEPIEVNGVWYYLTSVMQTNGVPTVSNWTTLGLLARERTGSATMGTPFWVHTPSGLAPTPQSGYPAYSFNEPVSTAIKNKVESEDYQIFMYPDTSTNNFFGKLESGAVDFFELSAIKTSGGIVRVSRDFTNNTQRAFFDYGDGVPVQSGIPSSPARQALTYLKDGRAAMCGGLAVAGRLELWFAVADINTMNFDAANVYRVIYGQATGQVFAGAFKNGLWSYPNIIHDIDDKIKIVCSKYKEGIFLFEFPYSSL